MPKIHKKLNLGPEIDDASSMDKIFSLPDGIVEAAEHGDRKWYVWVDGTWLETTCLYYCKYCQQHVEENSMHHHVMSQKHNAAGQYQPSQGKPAPAAPCNTVVCPPCNEMVPMHSNGVTPASASTMGTMVTAPPTAMMRPPPMSMAGSPLLANDINKADMLGIESFNWDDLEHAIWAEKNKDGYWQCIPCQKRIDEYHVESNGHRRKVEQFIRYHAQAPIEQYQELPPDIPVDTKADQYDLQNASWAERDQDGNWVCIPCRKQIDDFHLESAGHRRKLDSFLRNQEPSMYEDPPEEFLVWMLADEAEPNGEKWLRCLMCSKWVNDAESHSATGGSKEHVRNLLLHYNARSEWYIKNVLPQKQLHGRECMNAPRVKQPAAVPVREAKTPEPNNFAGSTVPQAKSPQAPPPWQCVYSNDHNRYYYWNRYTGESCWNHPEPEVYQ